MRKNSFYNKKCIINNIIYISVTEAARQLDIPENTVRGRIKNENEKFKNWKYE